MKTNWRPPEQLRIQQMMAHLRKEKMIPQFQREYSRSLKKIEVWSDFDKAKKKHYQRVLKRPFNYFKEEEYKKQKEIETLMHKIVKKEECVKYFSWQGDKLLFKGKEMDLLPEENPQSNPYHIFRGFDRKAFVSRKFDEMEPGYAEIEIDKVKLPKRRRAEAGTEIKRDIQKTELSENKEKRYKIQVIKDRLTLQPQREPFKRSTTCEPSPQLSSPTRRGTRRGTNRLSLLSQNYPESLKSLQVFDLAPCRLQLQENKLVQNLKQISESPLSNKVSVRVYRQQWKTIFNERYGHDNLTSFLCFDPISDYKEMEQMVKRILNMSEELIRFMCFNILDSNQDGQISDADLFTLLEYSKDNPLLGADYLTLARYSIENNDKQRNHNSESELFSSQPTYLTFMTKRSIQTQIKSRQPASLEDNPKFFCLVQSPEKKGTQLERFKRKASNRRPLQKSSDEKSRNSLSFQLYKYIFRFQRPMIFYDLLYVLARIQRPDIRYLPLKQLCIAAHLAKCRTQQDCESRRQGYLHLRSQMREIASKLPSVRP